MANNVVLLRNTAILYIRKIISIVLGLISARLLLQYLGVDDFGLYGLLGSVVGIFSSIRGVFASSVQRFINVARSQINESTSNNAIINQIFSTGLFVHFFIAISFLLIVNIGGFIMLRYLNIGENNYITAIIILECAILTSVISILTVPFDALIVSYERFNIYALFAIIDSIIRFCAVLLLALSTNRVIVYSVLVLLSASIVLLFNYLYCRKSFPYISKYKHPKDKKLIREMTSFAGWQFFGSTGYTISNQSLNFIINHFGGVALNAARGIAYQLMNTVQQFVSDISMSFQPKSMMSYGNNNAEFNKLFEFNTKLSFAICFAVVFPVCLFTEQILKIWLSEIPNYTVYFVQCILCYVLIRSIHGAIDIMFKSAGKMKYYQLTEFIIMIIAIPIAYTLLYIGYPYYWAFLTLCIFEILNLFCILSLAYFQLNFDLKSYFLNIFCPITIICIIGTIVFCFRKNLLLDSNSIWFLLMDIIPIEICTLIVLGLILLSNDEKKNIYKFIKMKIRS